MEHGTVLHVRAGAVKFDFTAKKLLLHGQEMGF